MVKVVFTTDRGLWHQEKVLQSAPDHLNLVMLRKPSKESLREYLVDSAYLISERSGIVDAETIQNAPNLKLIQRLGSLTFDIDLDNAAKAGVAVCYMPLPGVINVAEHSIMQILAVIKGLREVQNVAMEASEQWGVSRRTDEDTFAYNWSKRVGVTSIWGCTIGILGFGEIGAEFARRLFGWGCTILYHKRTRYPERVEKELKIDYCQPEEIYAHSDVLVNLLPYFTETDLCINAKVMDQMKTGATLVSCGSGSVIDEAALVDHVRSGKLAGAALDTFEWEPIKPDNPLIAAAKEGLNIILTPHTAAGTPARLPEPNQATHSRSMDFINIIRHQAGEPLLYRIV